MTAPSDRPPIAQIFAPQYHATLVDQGVSIRFGGEDSSAPFMVPLPQLGNPVVETWPVIGEPQRDGDLHYVTDGEVLLGWIGGPEGATLEDASRAVYERLLRVVRAHDYPFLLRFWNHVGSINEVEEGVERYQRFCVGRYDAMAANGYTMGSDLPAASAVGMHGRGLVVYFLAGRTTGTQVENPRQVAAYRYPRQYGPKSPSFSRATVWQRSDESVLFVSGTASVVGHQSVHHDDLSGQIDETLVNLEAVVGRAFDGGSLADFVSLKTYVRHPQDHPTIASRLEAAMPSCSMIYLESDICRRELLLEIEGVAVRKA